MKWGHRARELYYCQFKDVKSNEYRIGKEMVVRERLAKPCQHVIDGHFFLEFNVIFFMFQMGFFVHGCTTASARPCIAVVFPVPCV